MLFTPKMWWALWKERKSGRTSFTGNIHLGQILSKAREAKPAALGPPQKDQRITTKQCQVARAAGRVRALDCFGQAQNVGRARLLESCKITFQDTEGKFLVLTVVKAREKQSREFNDCIWKDCTSFTAPCALISKTRAVETQPALHGSASPKTGQALQASAQQV